MAQEGFRIELATKLLSLAGMLQDLVEKNKDINLLNKRFGVFISRN